MKILKIIITILISSLILKSSLVVYNDKPQVEFYYYNKTIDWDTNSNNAIVQNRVTKNIKYSKNADEKIYPASLTKIISVIVALENIEDLNEVVSVDIETYNRMINLGASMAGFYANEQITYWDLLYGTLLPSGGEAVNALAINSVGSTEEFVVKMNLKAQELNLKNTHFANVEGLHNPDHYTSARDMLTIVDYALDNEIFKMAFTTPTYTTTKTNAHPEGINLSSTVLEVLVGLEFEDFTIIGGKSGYTQQAGRNWITLGVKNNEEYISVMMNAYPSRVVHIDNPHIQDTLKIFELIEESYN